jgi:hypothetical protein
MLNKKLNRPNTNKGTLRSILIRLSAIVEKSYVTIRKKWPAFDEKRVFQEHLPGSFDLRRKLRSRSSLQPLLAAEERTVKTLRIKNDGSIRLKFSSPLSTCCISPSGSALLRPVCLPGAICFKTRSTIAYLFGNLRGVSDRSQPYFAEISGGKTSLHNTLHDQQFQ